jgi:hypothetical protein
VWSLVRDLGRCAFVGATGHRCHERRFVEFHHVDPNALGGEASVDQIELRCRPHNDYEGRLYFGKRRRAGMEAARDTGDARNAGAARDAVTSRGLGSAESASSFRNEFAGVKADDVHPGRLQT